MDLYIDFQSVAFPADYDLGNSPLTTNWDDLLWSALTVGRPGYFQVFQHGGSSFFEALFRLSLIRTALENGFNGYLYRTNAFIALDPTEKGAINYFVGMALCKLFAYKCLEAPWLLHLDVYRHMVNAVVQGKSRPDLVGQDYFGKWHAFEAKGRSYKPSKTAIAKAKAQSGNLKSVGGSNCELYICSFSYFQQDKLEFYWEDPEPLRDEPIRLPEPDAEWRHYFEPALSLAMDRDLGGLGALREAADVRVEIHHEVRVLLEREEWRNAVRLAQKLRERFLIEGYQPDGLKVIAGPSWGRPFRSRDAV